MEEDYITFLKRNYKDALAEIRKNHDKSPLGKTIEKIAEILKSKGKDITKAEIRDALIVFAALGEIDIEKYEQKRIDVILRGKDRRK